MKKKICLVIALAMTALALTACGEDKKPAETKAPETVAEAAAPADTAAPAASADRFSFATKGTVIAMKAEAAPILSALGDPKSYTEENSCAFDGLDKNYVYASFTMTTYPDGDIDRVNSLALMDDTVSTTDGISIGDGKDKVEKAYGADSFNGINAYILTEGDTTLTIIMDNDKVSSIQYAAVFE